MESDFNFALNCKNAILELTDQYKDALESIKVEIENKLPVREIYTDNIEIELIKLLKFIDTINYHSLKAISEGMINFEMRNKVKNLLTEDLSETQSKIILLISKGYTKTQIIRELNIKESTLRVNLKNIGNKLIDSNNRLVNAHFEQYPERVNSLIKDTNEFYSTFEFIQDMFDGLVEEN